MTAQTVHDVSLGPTLTVLAPPTLSVSLTLPQAGPLHVATSLLPTRSGTAAAVTPEVLWASREDRQACFLLPAKPSLSLAVF